MNITSGSLELVSCSYVTFSCCLYLTRLNFSFVGSWSSLVVFKPLLCIKITCCVHKNLRYLGPSVQWFSKFRVWLVSTVITMGKLGLNTTVFCLFVCFVFFSSFHAIFWKISKCIFPCRRDGDVQKQTKMLPFLHIFLNYIEFYTFHPCTE